MVVFCIFSHTPFSLWGLRVVERILNFLWGDFYRISCQDLELLTQRLG